MYIQVVLYSERTLILYIPMLVYIVDFMFKLGNKKLFFDYYEVTIIDGL